MLHIVFRDDSATGPRGQNGSTPDVLCDAEDGSASERLAVLVCVDRERRAAVVRPPHGFLNRLSGSCR